MLMYGTSQNIPDIENLRVFNLTGYTMDYQVLNLLVPGSQFVRLDSKEFDMMYYEYIFNNDEAFLQFFVIIQQLYTGKSVYIISNEEDWCENLVESLLKVIQQRYGYNAVYITCEDDFLQASNMLFDFEPFGLVNLDVDKYRYSYLVNQREIQTGNLIKGYYE